MVALSRPPVQPESYPTDLSDFEWELLCPYVEVRAKTGPKRRVNLRAVLNALRYKAKTGCQWEMLPRSFPPKSTVYDYFWEWGQAGVWEQMHDILRDEVHAQAGREASPSAAVIASQTVKTTEKGGRGATTAARKSPVASATSSSTPSG